MRKERPCLDLPYLADGDGDGDRLLRRLPCPSGRIRPHVFGSKQEALTHMYRNHGLSAFAQVSSPLFVASIRISFEEATESTNIFQMFLDLTVRLRDSKL